MDKVAAPEVVEENTPEPAFPEKESNSEAVNQLLDQLLPSR